MINSHVHLPPDASARSVALDPGQSFIVQAPAGSGKTELLIQRILTLLTHCQQPEEVLAITFTRKAAGEMKARLLDALEAAEEATSPESEHERLTRERARAVVEIDRQRGWGLIDNPSRLQVMTIDSLCSRLVKRMPWLSRFGSSPQISDDPVTLYRNAVESLLQKLEEDHGEKGAALESLLNHLENRVPRLRDLLVEMLGRRDQWLRHILGADQEQQRLLFEQSLESFVHERIKLFKTSLGDVLLNELISLAEFASQQLASREGVEISDSVIDVDSVQDLMTLNNLVRTGSNLIRKKVDKNLGFPADKDPLCVEMKQRMLDLLETIREDMTASSAFSALDNLPGKVYSDQQWDVLKALLVLLPLATVELVNVFSATGKVDFVELAGAARRALGGTENPEDLLLQFDSQVHHILIDEFQDTSHGQYSLLNQLTSGWSPGDGRTLFVVGDPMQSIYRFREAEVGLYLHARASGLPNVQLTSIRLSANFRSQQGVVDWVNTICPPLFPLSEDIARGAVTYAPAVAIQPELQGPAVELSCFSGRQDSFEAETVVQAINDLRRDKKIKTVAILVRSRAHLLQIVPALKAARIRYQAQEIDPLMSRPVARDLLSLTRALLHLGDRVSWLSILRAPWCGLQADDLLIICDDAGKKTIWQQLNDNRREPGLFGFSQDGLERLQRFIPIIDKCLQKRGTLSLRRLVESCWLALGGPACVSSSELNDATQIFDLLDQLDDGGDLVDFDQLETRLEKLYASPDPESTDSLQVMTIHKAKGLEFDAVILPGLGRRIRGDSKTLMRWIDHPDHGLMLAPIPASDQGDAGTTYNAIGAINQDRSNLESLRMFYVAVTRARQRLHLFGHVLENDKGEIYPPGGSLLHSIWPAIDPAAVNLRHPEPSSSGSDVRQPILLHRLPSRWSVPVFKSRAPTAGDSVQHASSQAPFNPQETPFALSSGYGRMVGTVVHEWLQIIAETSLDEWTDQRLKGINDRINRQLSALGAAESSLEELAGKVLKCIKNTLNSKNGRWILSQYDNQANELALNGVINGQIVHAVVDRTFVDAAGTRWVVDYKTSGQPDGLSLDQFLAKEVLKYQGQLQVYSTLLQALDPGVDVRCGLYFPMMDQFVEIDVCGVLDETI